MGRRQCSLLRHASRWPRARERYQSPRLDATLLLIYNAHFDVVNFTLPAVPEGLRWDCLVDTNQPEAQLASYRFGVTFAVTGRSLVGFGLTTRETPGRAIHMFD